MTNGDRLKRVRGYALGIIEESAWILGMAVFTFLMALAAKWIWP